MFALQPSQPYGASVTPFSDMRGPAIEPIVGPHYFITQRPETPPDSSPHRHEPLTTNEIINDIAIPDTGFYIRPVGSPPTTLERLKRIVAKQKACQRNTPTNRSNRKGSRNVEPPEWLEAEFLYRINFGPGTHEDVLRARRALHPANRGGLERRCITLLDREMAKLLHKAIFSKSRVELLFASDWSDGEVARDPWQNEPRQFSTPFDYPRSNEMDALISFEDYIVWTVWSKDYSPNILGETRPPQ
jgi:hypothetical protein